MNEKKQIIHIWKGQEGTICGLPHYPQKDGFVWLSKMGTMAAIQVNCEKCVESYVKSIAQKPKEPARELTPEEKHFLEAPIAEKPASELTKRIRLSFEDIKLGTKGFPRMNFKEMIKPDVLELCKRLDDETEIALKSLEACALANMENIKLIAQIKEQAEIIRKIEDWATVDFNESLLKFIKALKDTDVKK